MPAGIAGRPGRRNRYAAGQHGRFRLSGDRKDRARRRAGVVLATFRPCKMRRHCGSGAGPVSERRRLGEQGRRPVLLGKGRRQHRAGRGRRRSRCRSISMPPRPSALNRARFDQEAGEKVYGGDAHAGIRHDADVSRPAPRRGPRACDRTGSRRPLRARGRHAGVAAEERCAAVVQACRRHAFAGDDERLRQPTAVDGHDRRRQWLVLPSLGGADARSRHGRRACSTRRLG